MMDEQKSEDLLSIQDLLSICISRWYWIAISVVTFLIVATLYILTTPPTYTRTASLLIKNDQKGNSGAGDLSSAFSDMGIFKSNSNVNNELLSIQSPSLMLEVVKRLHLETAYYESNLMYDKTLYGTNLPIYVKYNNMPDDASASFDIILDGNRCTLTNFVYDDNKRSIRNTDDIICNLDQEINTPIGKLSVCKSIFYNKKLDNKTIIVKKSPTIAVTSLYNKALSVSLLNKDATVLSLSIKDNSVQRADDVLNTLVSVYNENWIKDKNQLAIATSNFINERLSLIEKELGDVDKDISSFKSEHLLPDVQEASKMYMTTANDVNNQLVQLKTQQYISKYIKNYLVSDINNNKLLPQISGVNNQSIENQITDYNTKVLEYNNLMSNSSPSNPLVIDLNKAITAMRGAIISSIDNQLININQQIKALEGSENEMKSKIAANPSQAKYLLSVERQQKVKEALYIYLLQKREENELTQAFTAYNTRLITPPMGLEIPTAPRKAIIILAALIIGLIVPVALIYIHEITNNKLRGKADVESMKMPFVGEIPFVGKKKKTLIRRNLIINEEKKRLLVVKQGSRNMINEAFRIVRTNIEFMIGGSKSTNNVLMTTSINPSSGKTFITMNTAASFAIKGSKVILIDLDLRKPALSDTFNNAGYGVADYLSDKIDNYREIIQPHEYIDNLDLIRVGTIPPNPTELLYRDKLKNMIDELRSQYDYIFLDCPPIEIVADASIINKHVDMTLFIARAGLFDKRLLPMIDELYTDRKYNNMALILNGTNIIGSKYGYNKYGYMQYGYGHKAYGYNVEEEDEE